MIKDHLAVMDDLKSYASPKSRMTRMLKAEQIIKVRRGLFVDDSGVSKPALAPLIYGPSYLSFQYALSIHGLIPERINSYTSGTYNKNKNKSFHTPLGDYYYYYLPGKVYPYGIWREENEGQPYLIASPEKALCDLLYKTSDILSLFDLNNLLTEDWRIDEEKISQLDYDFITFVAPLYRKRSLMLLTKYLKRMKSSA